MTPSPILKVLSTIRMHHVRHLLMGGQACVLYGAAEFSRDADLAIVADAENLQRFQTALDDLRAERIAVPPFEQQWLDLGLAVHFRCRHPQAMNVRVDLMSRMRGVDDFETLWRRRTTLHVSSETLEVMSLPDVVRAKKTQRDKDWPMIRRLVEANYFANRDSPSAEQIAFWLRELRTPLLLIDVAARFQDECREAISERLLLEHARLQDEAALGAALGAEEQREREADRAYWAPLRAILEQLRHERRS